ncbi:MAG: hypothetical protein ABII01_05895 [Candidatus Woesearchaeota archaeon]
MGKEKYQKKIEDLFEKSPVVSFSSIQRIIKDKKNIRQYSKQLVRNLILKGKINILAKGYYTKHDDPSLCVLCLDGYLGLQDSLSFHNLWDQETIPVIITAKKVRQGIREVIGTNVLVRRINRKYFFGFDYLKYGDFYLPVSDVEKTFIDMVYFRESLGKEMLKNLKKSVDKEKMMRYLKYYPARFREKMVSKLK